MSPQLSICEQLRFQALACRKLGSPLYDYLLTRCADDYERGGPSRAVLQAHANDPEDSVLSLRLMGAVHRLVLEGHVPELAKFYPSAGGVADDFEGAWLAFCQALREQAKNIEALIGRTVQTNEVGRSGSLLCGFGLIARRTGLPLRLLEIGASAGLNLRWDHYRYEWPGGSWGNAVSGIRLENVFRDGAPLIPPTIDVIERAGCDVSPIDVEDASGRLTLAAYLWPDQLDRIRRLDAAIEIARSVPCKIEKAPAADWLEERLKNIWTGATTVVFHSVMWSYVSAPEQQRIVRIIEDAANRASENAPLAWLRMELNDSRWEIRLRIAPGFQDQLIATTRAHAPSVRWLLDELGSQ
jgi:hypothetical protein